MPLDFASQSTAQMTAPRNAVPRAAVIGAGPVGCLAALSLANRGFQVDIYERRPDPRSHQIGSSSGSEAKAKPHVDRSINLAISARGLKALGKIQQEQGDNLADVVLNHAVPMYARMIHTRDEGKGVRLDSQPYSSEGKVSFAKQIQLGFKTSSRVRPRMSHQSATHLLAHRQSTRSLEG